MNAAVIVAAGRGSRMGLDRNKVLYPLCGEPIVVRTVRAFEESGLFDGGIVVVTGEGDMDEMRAMFDAAGVNVRAVVLGGADRQESVFCGVKACDENADIIAIHDGARPLVTREVIERTIESAKKYGSGVAAVMLKDTVKRVDENGCTLDDALISGVTLDQLKLDEQPFISVRIGIRDDAQYPGGINLFGEEFGDYNQPIIMKLDCLKKTENAKGDDHHESAHQI